MSTVNGAAHKPKVNGKTPHGVEPAPAPRLALSVKRVEEGESIIVRFLSDEYGGCITHYIRKRSEYCAGEKCRYQCHKERKYWKGYAPVEVNIDGTNKWRPYVLELTEHLELDLRGIVRRGQVWRIYRLHPVEGEKQPVSAERRPDQQWSSLTPPFDVLPVVRQLYHEFELVLNKKNPLPPRIVITDAEADAPVKIEADYCGPEMPIEQREAILALRRERKSIREIMDATGLPGEIVRSLIAYEEAVHTKMLADGKV